VSVHYDFTGSWWSKQGNWHSRTGLGGVYTHVYHNSGLENPISFLTNLCPSTKSLSADNSYSLGPETSCLFTEPEGLLLRSLHPVNGSHTALVTSIQSIQQYFKIHLKIILLRCRWPLTSELISKLTTHGDLPPHTYTPLCMCLGLPLTYN
jgi:hypothetical protein